MGKLLKNVKEKGFVEVDLDETIGDILRYDKFKKHGAMYILEDDTKAPSVTTIIGDNLGWNKNALMAWAKRQTALGNDVDAMLKDAGETGTLLHILIEAHQRGLNVDPRDFTENQFVSAMKCFTGYLNWVNKVKFKPLASELILVDNEQRVAGTVDCVGKVGDDLVLIDWKTSKYLYKEHKIQVAQYVTMMEKSSNVDYYVMEGGKPKRLKHSDTKRKFAYAMILRFDKTEVKYHQHMVNRKKIDAGASIFQDLLHLHSKKNTI
ncbi:MAG: hypothetical protein CMC15_18015 [Flavobacteriaceae bacterium]|nr:hypothetical protein [Flavobacteriaceae bacterium]